MKDLVKALVIHDRREYPGPARSNQFGGGVAARTRAEFDDVQQVQSGAGLLHLRRTSGEKTEEEKMSSIASRPYFWAQGFGWGICKLLEDHVSLTVAHRFYGHWDRWINRPLRYFRSWVYWFTQVEDRKYLAAAWKVRPHVARYLAGKFGGYTEWDCTRGAGHRITGFMPITRDAEGRKIFHTAKIVYDMRAMRGYAEMDLTRLQARN